MIDNTFEMTDCPECDECAVSFEMRDQKFPYGDKEKRVELLARVPVGSCRACGFSFTDERAGTARHEAVCAYLGIHTPKEIVAIRKQHGLSREGLSDITKIGEASIARWERGDCLQNAAMDQLLYLASFTENLNKLRVRNCVAMASKAEPSDSVSALILKFPCLKNEIGSKAAEGADFDLRLGKR